MNSTTKIASMFLLAAVLVAGTISITIPKSFAISFGESFAKYHNKKGTNVNVQKAKCTNIIINGVDKSHQNVPAGEIVGNGMADVKDVISQQSQGFANGEKKFKDIDRNIINYCLNQNRY